MSDAFSPTPAHDVPRSAPQSEEADGSVPNPETGVGVGAGAPSTFEPEEDAGPSTERPPAPGH